MEQVVDYLRASQQEITFKVCVVGPTNAGKTSVIRRYIQQKRSENNELLQTI